MNKLILLVIALVVLIGIAVYFMTLQKSEETDIEGSEIMDEVVEPNYDMTIPVREALDVLDVPLDMSIGEIPPALIKTPEVMDTSSLQEVPLTKPIAGTLLEDTLKPLIEEPVSIEPDSIVQPAKEINDTGHEISVSEKPMVDLPIIEKPVVVPKPVPCDIGFFRNNLGSSCTPCDISNNAGVVWISVGTSEGKCDYKCADGYQPHPSGDGCTKLIQEKNNDVKLWKAYKTICKIPAPLVPLKNKSTAVIRFMYFGRPSSNIPIYISNLKGNLVKINDFSEESGKCDTGVLNPRKHADVHIPKSWTGKYLIAVGGPKPGHKLSSLRAYQNIFGDLKFVQGSVKNLGPPDRETLSWFPIEARKMKLLYFQAPEHIANIYLKVDSM